MSETVMHVAGKEFKIVKKGREQAAQVIDVAKWLKNYGLVALQDMAGEEGEVKVESGADFISNIIDNLSPDALIDLYSILLGSSKKFAEENFDIGDLIEAGSLIYENQPSFRRLIERFFSTSTSETSSEESSMKSE